MLKIVDDVDLGILSEKYGFIKHEDFIYYREFGEVTVEVNVKFRELYLYSTGAHEVQSMSIPPVVFDLIMDGLIRKEVNTC